MLHFNRRFNKDLFPPCVSVVGGSQYSEYNIIHAACRSDIYEATRIVNCEPFIAFVSVPVYADASFG